MNKATKFEIHKILVQTIDRLSILGNLRCVEPATPDLPPSFEPFQERFDSERFRDKIYDETTNQKFDDTKEDKQAVKLMKDLHFCQSILNETIVQLKETENFDYFFATVNEMLETRKDEDSLVTEERNNYKRLIHLRNLVKEKQEWGVQELQRQTEKLMQLKDFLEDTKLDSNMKIRYNDSWESARREQNDLRIKLNENQLRDKISDLQTKISNEILVHDRLTSYLAIAQKDLEDKMNEWINKQDEDMEAKDLEIRSLSAQIADKKEESEELQSMLSQRQKQMDDYEGVKEERRLQAEEKQKRHKAATKIQAWWRGTMVRKGFGAYKKKQKKTSAKDSRKGKKK